MVRCTMCGKDSFSGRFVKGCSNDRFGCHRILVPRCWSDPFAINRVLRSHEGALVWTIRNPSGVSGNFES